MIAAPSLPPHNRGSLAGARPPPPLLRRVRRREWFSCCSGFLLSASRCARIVAGPARLGSARSLFEFLACVLRACGCLPALELGAYRFGLPVSRPLSQARSLARRGLSAPAGLPSRAPSPAAALWVGRVGFPPFGRLCRRALLRSSLGTAVCPFGAVFVPLSRGWLVFLPSVPLPRPRFAAVAPLGSRWEPALPRAALGVRPLSPHLGGSAPPLGCPLYLSLRCLAPSGRCAVTRLRFVAPSGLSASRLCRSAVPCRAVCMYAGVAPLPACMKNG